MKRPYPISFKTFFSMLAFCVIFAGMSVSTAVAQHRDHMTDAEIEIVRYAQDIDMRIDVLVKMIDRRFTALGINSGGEEIKKKELDKWGDAPTGTRIELFTDIRRLIDKAVDDLDVIAARNEDAIKQNKTEGELFPKAVRLLEAASRRYIPLLNKAAESSSDDRERGQILHTVESCEQIIAAAETLPPPVETNSGKSKRK